MRIECAGKMSNQTCCTKNKFCSTDWFYHEARRFAVFSSRKFFSRHLVRKRENNEKNRDIDRQSDIVWEKPKYGQPFQREKKLNTDFVFDKKMIPIGLCSKW